MAEQPGIGHHGHPAHIVSFGDAIERPAQRVALVGVARIKLIIQRNPAAGHQQCQHHLGSMRLAVLAVALEAKRIFLLAVVFPVALKIKCRGVIEQDIDRLREKYLSPGRRVSAYAVNHPLVKIVHGLIDPVQIQRHAAVSCQVHDGAAFRPRLGDARQHQFLDDAIGAGFAGTEQAIPAHARVKPAECFAHADVQAVLFPALSKVDAEVRRFAVASALAQKIRVLLGREQLLLRIGLLPEIFLDELAELHQLCQLGAAGRGADMADNLLAHLLAVAEALHDLHPVSVSGGIEFLSYKHG